MKNRRSPFISALSLGALLFIAVPLGALADDSNDDAKQPHLKAWSNIIPTAKRFVVLSDFNNQAVLDRETSLVWEQAPTQSGDWMFAQFSCATKSVGGRLGWRLPAISELSSLAILDVGLPPGHPFVIDLSSALYWSSTTHPLDSINAMGVHMGDGRGFVFGHSKVGGPRGVWCVRGGMNADAN